jgi:hypothetical protein
LPGSPAPESGPDNNFIANKEQCEHAGKQIGFFLLLFEGTVLLVINLEWISSTGDFWSFLHH